MAETTQPAHTPPDSDPDDTAQPPWYRRIKWGQPAKFLVGLGLVYLAVREVDISLLWQSLLAMHPGWVLLVVISVVVSTGLKVLRWWLMLKGSMPGLSPWMVFGPFVTGQTLNMFTWARLGDVARITLMTTRAGQVASTVGITATVAAEKMLDLLFLGLVALLLVGQTTLVTMNMFTSWVLVGLVGITGVVTAARFGGPIVRWLSRLLARFNIPGHERIMRWLTVGVDSLRPLTDWRLLVSVVAVTALTWVLAWLNNELLLNAVGFDAPPAAALMVLVLGYIGVAPGLTPTNIGPIYLATTVSLTLYGMTDSMALAYAAVLHLVVSGVPLVGALIYLVTFRMERARLQQLLRDPPPKTPVDAAVGQGD